MHVCRPIYKTTTCFGLKNIDDNDDDDAGDDDNRKAWPSIASAAAAALLPFSRMHKLIFSNFVASSLLLIQRFGESVTAINAF